MTKRKRERYTHWDTVTWSVGAVTLDVEMAREHGWSERDIEKACAALKAVSLRYGRRARLRHPERYETENGDVVFKGRDV